LAATDDDVQATVLLPLSWALINELFGCLREARWLVHAISWAALGRVENPSRLPFVFDDEVALPASRAVEWDVLMCDYTGIDPQDLQAEQRERQRRADIIAAAERPGPSPNRASAAE
jgi:hypothetical protein